MHWILVYNALFFFDFLFNRIVPNLYISNAGMGKMHYYYFMVYNLIGGTLWVGIFCYAGYFFGDLPFVQKNLKLLIVAIIVVSILPAVIEVGRNKWKTRNY